MEMWRTSTSLRQGCPCKGLHTGKCYTQARPPVDWPRLDPCFRIHGQIYHQVQALHPEQGKSPQHGQMYILEGYQATQARLSHPMNDRCTTEVMDKIQDVSRGGEKMQKHVALPMMIKNHTATKNGIVM